jgi:hypothetical protein
MTGVCQNVIGKASSLRNLSIIFRHEVTSVKLGYFTPSGFQDVSLFCPLLHKRLLVRAELHTLDSTDVLEGEPIQLVEFIGLESSRVRKHSLS